MNIFFWNKFITGKLIVNLLRTFVVYPFRRELHDGEEDSYKKKDTGRNVHPFQFGQMYE